MPAVTLFPAPCSCRSSGYGYIVSLRQDPPGLGIPELTRPTALLRYGGGGNQTGACPSGCSAAFATRRVDLYNLEVRGRSASGLGLGLARLCAAMVPACLCPEGGQRGRSRKPAFSARSGEGRRGWSAGLVQWRSSEEFARWEGPVSRRVCAPADHGAALHAAAQHRVVGGPADRHRGDRVSAAGGGHRMGRLHLVRARDRGWGAPDRGEPRAFCKPCTTGGDKERHARRAATPPDAHLRARAG